MQLFAFLAAGQPGGGGTVVIAGSHRLLNEGPCMRMKEMRRLPGRDDYFRKLYSEAPARAEERARLLTEAYMIGDVELRVVELTGAPGDAWFVDLRVLHAAAPNAADRPRMMVTHRFVRADLMPEIAEAYGWR